MLLVVGYSLSKLPDEEQVLSGCDVDDVVYFAYSG